MNVPNNLHAPCRAQKCKSIASDVTKQLKTKAADTIDTTGASESVCMTRQTQQSPNFFCTAPRQTRLFPFLSGCEMSKR
eukprot:jgi/Bigna1/60428/fgenesh1_kg.11_\